MIAIEKFLKEIGISQAELARRLNVPPQTISRMLKGGDMKLSNIIKIADALGIPVSAFFESPNNSIGHKVFGIGNTAIGDIALSDCQSELEKVRLENEHLRAQIEGKDQLLEEKERTINILMSKK